jgi:hypothetical protein
LCQQLFATLTGAKHYAINSPMAWTPSIIAQLAQLEPGQTREFNGDTNTKSVRRAASRLQDQNPGWRFVCRSLPDGVYKVWRTA